MTDVEQPLKGRPSHPGIEIGVGGEQVACVAAVHPLALIASGPGGDEGEMAVVDLTMFVSVIESKGCQRRLRGHSWPYQGRVYWPPTSPSSDMMAQWDIGTV